MNTKEQLRLDTYRKGLDKAFYDLHQDQFNLNQYKHRPLHIQIDKVQALLGNDWLVVINHD